MFTLPPLKFVTFASNHATWFAAGFVPPAQFTPVALQTPSLAEFVQVKLLISCSST